MFSLILLVGLIAGGDARVAPMVFNPFIETDGNAVTLAEVADISVLPPDIRAQAAALVLYKLPKSRKPTRLPREALASRARSLLPILNPWLANRYEGDVVVNADVASQNLPSADCGDDGLDAGGSVMARLESGAFAIERSVRLLQPAEPGGRFFAQTSDGGVMTVFCKGDF